MGKFNKSFISALIHKPDLIAEYMNMEIDFEVDEQVEKGLDLLFESGLLSRSNIYTHWDDHYKIKPPDLKELLSYIMGKDRLQETDRILTTHFPEAVYMKEIFETVSPDEEVMNMKRTVNGFDHYHLGPEFVPIVKNPYPNLYFKDLGIATNATCRNCGVTTYINWQIRYRFKGSAWAHFKMEHQCQDCGALKMDDLVAINGHADFLENPCECGGQFRRDKPIFCPNCKYNKTPINKSEWVKSL
jgi:hypothetical protein